ncbi:acyl carrier protein [Suttonella sp. R2A3]|uniref:acyl carrier protein n=1 Tax=Suttonella sp. R2A3 TaxID=2908648 RepID=UPI0038FCCA36
MDRAQILALMREAMQSLFEIEPEHIVGDAHLYNDLEIDSIDAIDLIDYIKRQTGHKLVADDFRSVRTIDDVINAVMNKQAQTQTDA